MKKVTVYKAVTFPYRPQPEDMKKPESLVFDSMIASNVLCVKYKLNEKSVAIDRTVGLFVFETYEQAFVFSLPTEYWAVLECETEDIPRKIDHALFGPHHQIYNAYHFTNIAETLRRNEFEIETKKMGHRWMPHSKLVEFDVRDSTTRSMLNKFRLVLGVVPTGTHVVNSLTPKRIANYGIINYHLTT